MLCYGETKAARVRQRATDAECRAKLVERLKGDFRAGLHDYFTEATRAKRLTPERDAAYVSLAYNVGIRRAGRSTATRRLNAGDIAGGGQSTDLVEQGGWAGCAGAGQPAGA